MSVFNNCPFCGYQGVKAETNSASSQHKGYFQCLNKNCGIFFTGQMVSASEEILDKLRDELTITPIKNNCPFCNYEAVKIKSEIWSSRDNGNYHCLNNEECGKQFTGSRKLALDIKNKIENATTKELQEIIDTSLDKIHNGIIKYGNEKNAKQYWIGDYKAIIIIHERLKRIEDKL